jgi:hypothetical protein
MKPNHLKLIVLVMLLGLAQRGHAELKWEQTVIELHPAPGDKSALGTFKYRNEGDQPVHIKSVQTSCGCTTTSKMKDVIAPGESGELAATLKIGSSLGTVTLNKTVTVETDDPKSPVTELTLRAVIPPLIELQPSFVYWQNIDRPKPQVITLKIAKEAKVKNVNVASSSPQFSTKVTSAGANQFKIEVQPRDISRDVSATLTITPDNGVGPVYAKARVISAANSD